MRITQAFRGFVGLDYICILSFTVYSSSVVVTPISLLILAREFNFSLADAGVIELVRQTLAMVLMLLSGFIAGRWGKARALGWGGLVLGLGFILYAYVPSYGAILMAIGLVGVGGGVMEALINPLVQDLHPTDSGKYLNIINGFWSVGVLVTMLLVGELLTQAVSWRWIMWMLGLWSIVVGVLFLFMQKQSPEPRPMGIGEVMQHYMAMMRCRLFWVFATAMFVAGFVEGGLTYWLASFIQLQYDTPPREGGIGTACFAAGMMIGRFVFGWFVPQAQLPRLIWITALSGMVVSGLIPVVSHLYLLYAILLLVGICIACYWPSLQSLAADGIGRDATTLFILLSCAGIPGFAGSAWLIGQLGDRFGLAWGLAIIPAFFLALVIMVCLNPKIGQRVSVQRESLHLR